MLKVKQTARKAEAIRLRLQGLTYAEIGKVLGVSRQRAQQLVRPPAAVYRAVRAKTKGACADCGLKTKTGHVHHNDLVSEDDFNDFPNLVYLCVSCHTRRHGPGTKVSGIVDIPLGRYKITGYKLVDGKPVLEYERELIRPISGR